jgi:hypothetical protein
MTKQPLNNNSLVAKLKEARLLMGSKVSKKLTIDDLESLALFITEAQELLGQLGKTLGVKQVINTNYKPNTSYVNPSSNNNYNNYNNNNNYNNQPSNMSVRVASFDPKQDVIGPEANVSLFDPEVQFKIDAMLNNTSEELPISDEQLEAEARILNDRFSSIDDLVNTTIEEDNVVT